MAKVAIIGAGIIGVCVAHFLRKGNHEVIIFDHNDPGTQTSYGNAGIFANHDCVFRKFEFLSSARLLRHRRQMRRRLVTEIEQDTYRNSNFYSN